METTSGSAKTTDRERWAAMRINEQIVAKKRDDQERAKKYWESLKDN